ncbi:MAG: hypothetical protein RR209_02255 [Angelakisella sp.]
MNLHNGNITVRELLRNPKAQQILQREFPGVMGSPMFRMAQNMSLNTVIGRVRSHVPQSKIDKLWKELSEI